MYFLLKIVHIFQLAMLVFEVFEFLLGLDKICKQKKTYKISLQGWQQVKHILQFSYQAEVHIKFLFSALWGIPDP